METEVNNPQVLTNPTLESIAQDNAAQEEKQTKMYDRIAFVMAASYFIALFLFYQPISNGPDSNGYYIQARLLVDTGKPWFERESLMQYTSPHWLEYEDKGFIASRYPPGMALVLAVPYLIGGTYAMPLINLVFTALSAFGLYLICKKWIGPLWGLFAMIAIITNPVINQWAFIGFAHVTTAFFLVWGLYFLTHWEKSHSPLIAFGLGLWFGFIPALRYPEGLFMAAIGLFLLIHIRQSWRCVQSVIAYTVGGVIPIAGLLFYNYKLYGHFGGTGYESNYSIFGFQYFRMMFFPYLGALATRGSGFFFILAILCFIKLLRRSDLRKYGILLVTLIGPITLTYMSYFFPDPSMRFLMPTLYIYAIAGVWFFQMIVGLAPRMIKICLILILVGNITLALAMTGMNMFTMHSNTGSVVKAAEIIKKYAKPGDIIITPTNLQIHFDFLGTWRVADGSLISTKSRTVDDSPLAVGPDNKPVGAQNRLPRRRLNNQAMFDLVKREINIEAQERYKTIRPGELSNAFLNDLFIWSQPDRSIFWIEKWDEMVQFDTNRIHLEKLDEVEVPLRVYGMPGAGPGPGPGPGMGQGPGPGGRMGPPPGPPPNRGPMGGPQPGGFEGANEQPPDLNDPDHVQPNVSRRQQGEPRPPRPALGFGLSEETETMAVARVRLLIN